MAELARVGDQTDILGESPLWNEREQALYWIDIRRPALRRLDHASGRIDTWSLPDLVGSIAFCDDGGLLMAISERIASFDLATGSLTTIATLPTRIPGHRFNDGRCDHQGRFWVGTMHNLTRAPEGVLYRLDARGQLIAVDSGICIPNSLAWSPDGRTMYFADSLLYTIFAYDFDPYRRRDERRARVRDDAGARVRGRLDSRRRGLPLECRVQRLARGALRARWAVDRVIDLPTHRPTCCAFGGPNLETLYITTASQQMSADELAKEPLAGSLLAMDVGVRGLVEPRFVRPKIPSDGITT